MPSIPHFASDIIARPAKGRIEASQIVPEAIAKLGQQGQRFATVLAEMEVQKNEVQNAIEAKRREAEFETELQNRIIELENAPDPSTHSRNVLMAADEIATRHLSESTNPAVRDRLASSLTNVGFQRFRESRRFENKILVEQGQVAFLTKLDRRRREAAEALDVRDVESALEMGVAEIKDAQALGLFSPAKAYQLEQQLRKQVRLDRASREAHDDPERFLDRIDGPEFADLEPDERLALEKSAEAQLARRDRLRERQEAQQRDLENRDFFRKLKGETLTVPEVLGSRYLTRQDMDFFVEALRKRVDPQTDPTTFIALDEMLASEGRSREVQLNLAREAKSQAQQLYVKGDLLSQEDAKKFIGRANKILAGEDPESDRWMKAAKRYVSDRFGGQITMMPDGQIAIKFLDPKAATIYWRIVSQLMVEQEDRNLGGRSLFERAVELTQGEGIGFWMDQLSEPGTVEEVPTAAGTPKLTGAAQEAEDFMRKRRKRLPVEVAP